MWTEADNTLMRTFEFQNFAEALAFVNKVGSVAEKLGHHPNIHMRDYKYVDISTTTHDAGQVTEKDHELTRVIESLL